MFSAFSSLFLPSYTYQCTQVEPLSSRWITLVIKEFDAEKGTGLFEVTWIEDRTPLDTSLPDTREVVTIIGKAEVKAEGISLTPQTASSHLKATVARLGPFASIGVPRKNRTVTWKSSQGQLPTFSVLTPAADITTGAAQITFEFVPISQKDIEGQTQALLQPRQTEKVRLISEAAQESVTIEYKGEKIEGPIESYMTLSFLDLDKISGSGRFVLEWVEDYTPSFGKTTREVVEIRGIVQTTDDGIVLSPHQVLSKFKVTVARLASVASLSLPFSTSEVTWSLPRGYAYDGAVPQFKVPFTIADISEGKVLNISLDYVRLCQDSAAEKIVAKEKQPWNVISTTAVIAESFNGYLSTIESNWNAASSTLEANWSEASANWNRTATPGVPVDEAAVTTTTTTTTTTTSEEPGEQ
eukprot:TRINITY_DN15805_c0_g1_i1.p1 TRINITY_DN15805_c0_g1~~TRINITY_DN15805_c0_g1_i1.p1  ORF type:complete len:412 (-),score=102.99 TRINITY_DN15805_c0_g1_i1:19-1254(-)